MGIATVVRTQSKHKTQSYELITHHSHTIKSVHCHQLDLEAESMLLVVILQALIKYYGIGYNHILLI